MFLFLQHLVILFNLLFLRGPFLLWLNDFIIIICLIRYLLLLRGQHIANSLVVIYLIYILILPLLVGFVVIITLFKNTLDRTLPLADFEAIPSCISA